MGTQYSLEYRYFILELFPCDKTRVEECKNQEDVAKFFYRNNILQIIYSDGYIDLHERLDMIKTQLNDY